MIPPAASTYLDQQWRQLVYLSCHRHFLEIQGTPLHAKQADPDKLVGVIIALAEGLGIRAVARVAVCHA